jgi:hypothetical protein
MAKQRLVKKGGQYGILDESSNTVLPISENMKLVQKQGQYGILDGDSVLPIDNFSESITDSDLDILKKKNSTESVGQPTPKPTSLASPKIQGSGLVASPAKTGKEEIGVIDDLWNSFKGAGAKALASIAAVPQFAQNAAIDIMMSATGRSSEFNKLPSATKKQIRDSINESLYKNTPSGQLNQSSQAATDYLNKKSEDIYKKTRQEEVNVIDELANFTKDPSIESIQKILYQGLKTTVESIPYMAVGAVSLPAMGVSAAAAKREEDISKDGNVGIGNLINAGVTGAAEAVFEGTTNKILKKAATAAFGNPKASKVVAEGFVKSILKDFGQEGASEGATTLIQDLSDKITKGEEVNFWALAKNVGNSAILGGISGGGISLTGAGAGVARKYVAGKIMPKEQKEKIEGNIKTIQSLNLEQGDDVDPKVNQVVNKKIDELLAENEAIMAENESVAANLSGDQVKQIFDIDDKLEENYNSAKSIIDDASMDESAKKLLLQDLLDQQNKLKQDKDAIQKQTASQVPVQPETGSRIQMAEGEPQAEPQVPAKEGQREEIERRRQDELAPYASQTSVSEETFEGLDINDEPIVYVIRTKADGSREIRVQVIIDGEIKTVPIEKKGKDITFSNSELMEKVFGLQNGKSVSINNNPINPTKINKINEKYDAELAALKTQARAEEGQEVEPAIAAVDITTPTQFKDGEMPEIPIDQIDWEASGMGSMQEAIDMFGGINDISVVEVKGKNENGEYVGKVRVVGQDTSKEGDIVFKDPNAPVPVEKVEEKPKDPKFESAKQLLKDKGVYPLDSRVKDLMGLSENNPGQVTGDQVGEVIKVNKSKAQSIASALNRQVKQETKAAEAQAKLEEQRKPKPKIEQPTAEVNDAAIKSGVSATGLWSLFKINKKAFGLGNKQALASAIVMDRIVGTMAKRAGTTKSEIYKTIVFKQGTEADLISQPGRPVLDENGNTILYQKNFTVENFEDFIAENDQRISEIETDDIGGSLENIKEAKEKLDEEIQKIKESSMSTADKREAVQELKEDYKSTVEGSRDWIKSFKDQIAELNRENNKYRRAIERLKNPKSKEEVVKRQKKQKEQVEKLAEEIPVSETPVAEKPAEQEKFKWSKNPTLEKFLNELSKLRSLEWNPIFPNVLTYGNGAALQFSTFNKGENELDLQKLLSYEKSKGIATQVMKDITSVADKNGVTLTLYAQPFSDDNNRLGNKDLVNFYKKNGFVIDPEYMKNFEFDTEEDAIKYAEKYKEGTRMIRVPQSEMLFQKAYHGGNVKFNKFSTGQIGSGNKSRFGGWGLYFTLDKARAGGYASQLKNDSIEIGDIKIYKSDYKYTQIKDIFEKTNSVIGIAKELLKLSEINKQESIKALNDEFNGKYKEYEKAYEKATLNLSDGIDIENSKKTIRDFEKKYKDAENGLYGFYSNESYGYRKKAKEVLSKGGKLNNQPAYVYEVAISDDLNLLDFDETITEDNYNRILNQALKENSKFVPEIIKNKDKSGRNFYFNVSQETDNNDNDQELSLLMLRSGIDGNIMRSEGTQDIILFDENAVEINDIIQFQQSAQGAQGAMQLANDGRSIIYALTNPNVSTPLHEIAHVYESYLKNLEKRDVLAWTGQKEWNRETSEKFARGFEKWLSTGKAPSAGLKKIFAQFKAWLTEIYNGIKGSEIDLKLNPAMEKIYKAMVSEKGKQASPPSVNKILGITIDKQLVNIDAAVKDYRKMRIKDVKLALNAYRAKIKELLDGIKELGKSGKLTSAQVKALLNTFSGDLLNQTVFDRAMARAKRIIENSQYAEKVSNANGLRLKIRKALSADNNKKRKDKLQAAVANMASNLAKVAPKMVDDIDLYLERANEVLAAIRNPKITDVEVIGRMSADMNAVNEYAKDELNKQEQARKDEMLDQYDYLVEAGVLNESMSLRDINKLVAEIMDGKLVESDKLNEAGLVFYRSLFNDYSQIINKMLSGTDPITGEDTDISEGDKELIRRFLAIDPEKVTDLTDMFNIANAAQEFITNDIIDNMEVMVKNNQGLQNVRTDADNPKMRGYEAVLPWVANFAKLPIFSKIINIKLAPVQEYIRNIFRGETNAVTFEKNSGFTGIYNGSTKAMTDSDIADTEYVDRFYNKKPNGKKFFDVSNVFERGIFADLYRTTFGTEAEVQEEFERKLGQLELTIKEKEKSDKKIDQEEASALQKSYDKIVKGSKNINDVMSKMAKDNIDGVMWWIDKWDSKFPEIDRVAKSTYNDVLERQANYTPEGWVKIADQVTLDDDMLSRSFNKMNMSYVDTRRAGTLMKYSASKGLPVNDKTKEVTHVKSYHFDINNSESFKKTLKDVYTAPSIVQYMAYTNSPEFSTIIPDKKTRDNLKEKIAFAINALKDTEIDISAESYRDYNKAMKKFTDIARAQALVSVKTPIMQTVPVVVGTAIDLVNDPASFAKGMVTTFNMDFHKALNKAGYGISVRGLEAIAALDAAEKRIRESKGVDLNVFNNIAKISNLQLKYLLSKPDIVAARQAWVSYYYHKLKSMGIDTANIDWDTHEFNDDAANYAERKTNSKLNQNIQELAGQAFASRSQKMRFIRNTVLNFASFAYNMKYRFWTDLTILGSKNSNSIDKADAAKDIVRTTGEGALYVYIGAIVGHYLKGLMFDLVGYDEPEEDKKSAEEYLNTNMLTKGILDLLSPMPGIGDLLFVKGINNLADLAFGEQEKEMPNKEKLFFVKARPEVEKQFRLYEPPEKTESETYLSLLGGMSGIFGKNINELYKSGKLIQEGEQFQIPNPSNPNKPLIDKKIEYTDKFDNKIEFSNKEKEMMKLPFLLQTLGTIGLGVRDQAETANKVRRSLEKRAKKRMATSKKEKLFYVPKAE